MPPNPSGSKTLTGYPPICEIERTCPLTPPIPRSASDTLLQVVFLRSSSLQGITYLDELLGDDAGLTAENCVHVDSFLYDVDDEEMLVEEGLLSRFEWGFM